MEDLGDAVQCSTETPHNPYSELEDRIVVLENKIASFENAISQALENPMLKAIIAANPMLKSLMGN